MTLTKVRWSRRKNGIEYMTESQSRADVETQTEEEESLAEALATEMRYVMANDGSKLDMGSKRSTDLKNNRDIKIPGPAPLWVEAEYTNLIGAW